MSTDAETVARVRALLDKWKAGDSVPRQALRDALDPPEWRRLVDEQHCEISGSRATPLGNILALLSQIENGVDGLCALARIIAVCERQVGEGWQAEPDREPAGVSSVLVPLSHRAPDWATAGDRAAAWLRDLMEGRP